jgi:peptide/nickel transport system permease protein
MFLDRWYLRPFGKLVFSVLAVVTISFGLVKALPGGPAAYIKAQLALSGASGEEVTAMVDRYFALKPDEPLYVQYVDYMTSVLTGDLGTSFTEQEPVTAVVAQFLPWTVFYASISLVLAYIIGISVGVFMAQYEGTRFDTAGTVVSTVIYATPYYGFALIFIYLLGNIFPIFPTGGKHDPALQAGLYPEFLLSVLYYAALPILSFTLSIAGVVALQMRSNSISVLGKDYLRSARLRGLPPKRVMFQYLGKNAILPLYTTFMLSLGLVFGGAVVLETIFRYTGIGFVMVQAISARDTSLLLGAFMVITFAVIVGIIVASLTYSWIDPRARTGHNAT